MEKALPSIPAKRYFTIGEVSDLCGVKPHVLRYWEQEFTQLRPMKRRGNRRYYQHHEVLMIRRIRDLLYDQGFTISGARNKLQELVQLERDKRRAGEVMLDGVEVLEVEDSRLEDSRLDDSRLEDSRLEEFEDTVSEPEHSAMSEKLLLLRRELFEIRDLLSAGH
ncbi:MAG TPA: MerR family transcriptional regulator [Ramlibacter sp.]|uniref:MerR family transcriptional regulator n=1 Tax=Ramlibacter sp. TaxID=1917967 RepID=UPI002D73853A|nr:MerR family transcriptional regulator [Ramlibacter sp.]HZY19305.1 MerR family transcriptional regulator [Ramlibacter sp.]